MKRIVEKYSKRVLPATWGAILEDPRRSVRRWTFDTLLRGVMKGMVSGVKNSRDLEGASERAGKRLPDTTVWDLLVQIDPSPLNAELARGVKHALRSHELDEKELPINLIACDGKVLSVASHAQHPCAINRSQRGKKKYVVTALRAFLGSTALKLHLAQEFVPRGSNERGAFPRLLATLVKCYGRTKLLDVLSLDAGIASKKNAALIVAKGLFYLMALKDARSRKVTRVAIKLLASRAYFRREDQECVNGCRIVRRLYRALVPDEVRGWDGARELWRVEKNTCRKGQKVKKENHYFITSMPPERLTDTQALATIRHHWTIENNAHWVLDTAWKEDKNPWCNKALELISLLRLMSFNVVARLRARKLNRLALRARLTWQDTLDLVRRTFFPLPVTGQPACKA